MKKLLFVCLLLASQSGLHAETIEAQNARYGAETIRATKSCSLTPAQQRFVGDTTDFTLTYTITGWTGGCVAGMRDGHGTLSDRVDTVDNKPIPPGADGFAGLNMSGVRQSVSTGTFVRGEEIGLWCVTEGTVRLISGFTTQLPLGCGLVGEGVQRGLYRKEADGRWRALAGSGVPIEPATYVDAGVMEATSDRMVAEARAGKKSAPVLMTSTTQALGDLVGGGRLTMALDDKPLDLKSRRVAVVLSSDTLKEFARFKAMRQGLIDATAKTGGKLRNRADFIAVSDPTRVMAAIGSGVQPNVQSMVAADDLSVLADGKADYVLLVDWGFTGDFNLTAKEFAAVPPCDLANDAGCHPLFSERMSMMVVRPDMKVVRQLSIRQYKLSKSITDTGYDDLFSKLRFHIDGDWRLASGTLREEVAYLLREANGAADWQ